MSRLSRDELIAAAQEHLGGVPDPAGKVDLVSEDRGSIMIAAEAGDFKGAFKKLKKIEGYRWVMMNKEDLFAANTLSIGSKAGMMAGDGSVLKNADLPRKKI